MYPIDPGEEWGESRILGGSQIDVYEPLYTRVHPAGHTITRWRLTDEERRIIAEGGDLFLSVLQFGQPFQPVSLWAEGKVIA